MKKSTFLRIFGAGILSLAVIFGGIFFFENQKGSFENDILGKIINCSAGGKVEKTFTLNTDGSFKMMVLPFDVWGKYDVIRRDENSAEVKLSAKNLYSSKGDRSSALSNKDLSWKMRVDFSKKGNFGVKSDAVKIDFAGDTGAEWSVASEPQVIFEGCRAE